MGDGGAGGVVDTIAGGIGDIVGIFGGGGGSSTPTDSSAPLTGAPEPASPGVSTGPGVDFDGGLISPYIAPREGVSEPSGPDGLSSRGMGYGVIIGSAAYAGSSVLGPAAGASIVEMFENEITNSLTEGFTTMFNPSPSATPGDLAGKNVAPPPMIVGGAGTPGSTIPMISGYQTVLVAAAIAAIIIISRKV